MTARIKGLLALVGLLAIVVGVPWLLVAIGAGPVPDEAPTLDGIWQALTSPDDGSVFLTLFRYAAWLAWLFFVVSLVLELYARATGNEAPRLPGLSLPQGAARALVSAAALLFVTAPVVTAWAGSADAATTAGFGGSGSTISASTVEIGATALSAAEGGSAVADSGSTTEARDAGPTKEHVVAQGETLWSIAETHLGDGARYPEIVNLNPGTITASHWISPGTTIDIPDDGTSGGAAADATVTVEQGDTLWEIAEDELGEGSRYTEIVDATGSGQQPGGGHLTDPDLIQPGWELQVPGADGSTAAASRTDVTGTAARGPGGSGSGDNSSGDSSSGDTAAAAASGSSGAATSAPVATGADAADESSGDLVLTEEPGSGWGATALGLGGVTAAGTLGLIALARRRRARTLGRPPQGDALDPRELELALAADGHTVEIIDLALKHLVLAAEQAGRGMPGLRMVRMTRDQIDVQLATAMRLPAPWTSTADPRLWTLAADRAMSLDRSALAGVPAPFPGLVTIGQDDEQAHVLVNVVDARVFAVAGQNVHTRSALAAMALDLAGSPWAERTVVSVVGAHPGLTAALGSPRVRVVQAADDYALSAAVVADSAVREIIIATGQLDDAGRRRLEQAVASSPRVALLHAADRVQDESASLTISADPTVAVLSPSYLQLRPQLLGDEDAAAVGELCALAAASTDRWAPPAGEPTLASIGAAAAAMGAPGVVIDADPTSLPADDAPTIRRSDLDVDTSPAGDTTPALWNSPITSSRPEHRVPGDDVDTVRRGAGETGGTTDGMTPGWLSTHITPTPGTPLPPVIAFPQRVRELAAPTDAPVLRVLGPVDIDNVGPVEEAHRARLTELVAFIRLHPAAGPEAIDDAMWPNRSRHDHSAVRDRSLAAVGAWLTGRADAATGLTATRQLSSDWDLWSRLLPSGIEQAPTDRLEQALSLVRGRPFVGAQLRHYTWAVGLRATMVHDITLAAAELARRRLMEGQWSAAHDATVVGLTVEPSVEALWRMQLVAAHERGDLAAVDAARGGLRVLSSSLGDPLELRTRQLLDEIEAADAPTQTHAV